MLTYHFRRSWTDGRRLIGVPSAGPRSETQKLLGDAPTIATRGSRLAIKRNLAFALGSCGSQRHHQLSPTPSKLRRGCPHPVLSAGCGVPRLLTDALSVRWHLFAYQTREMHLCSVLGGHATGWRGVAGVTFEDSHDSRGVAPARGAMSCPAQGPRVVPARVPWATPCPGRITAIVKFDYGPQRNRYVGMCGNKVCEVGTDE